MEKQRNKILAFLPKAASAVTFQISPPVSPAGKGYPAPIVSLIPREARRKSRNGSFDAREPTSPKVSCMGQVKGKKKKKETLSKSKKLAAASPPPQAAPAAAATLDGAEKRKPFLVVKVLKGIKRSGHRKSDVPDAVAEVAESVPSLLQMKQLSSARGALSDFDWRKFDAGCARNPLYVEKGVKSEEEEKVAGRAAVEETRKDHLWKRRSIAPLNPIQL